MQLGHAPRERVSWNEYIIWQSKLKTCHAPRERVSWNSVIEREVSKKWKSRSTWACELKWQNSLFLTVNTLWSRSTWACELKYCIIFAQKCGLNVTLHVSVWVEIQIFLPKWAETWSRSTWACELKLVIIAVLFVGLSHAPRERVSWNEH